MQAVVSPRPHSPSPKARQAGPWPAGERATPPRQAVPADGAKAGPERLAHARERFLAHVADAGFPCVGARSAMNRQRLRFGAYGALAAPENAGRLCCDLYRFLAEFSDPGTEPVSFIALFDDAQVPEDELAFEQALWQQLQQLHEVDRQHHAWDPTVSPDPSRDDFSFSVGGRGMFVVGMNPHASRLARRTPMPVLVFNLHAQFEAMRANGKYESMQRAVRKRDIALQGSINPVLARFGEASEAIQYAGRAVQSDWRCPFHSGGAKS